MTIRSIAAVAAIAVGVASPVLAQNARTSDAPAFRSDRSAPVAPVQATRTINVWGSRFEVPMHDHEAVHSQAPRGVHVSGNSGRTIDNVTITPVQATRTINVWGARFEVPAY